MAKKNRFERIKKMMEDAKASGDPFLTAKNINAASQVLQIVERKGKGTKRDRKLLADLAITLNMILY